MKSNDSGPHYTPGQVLRRTANWKELWFYQKSDALYQLTVIFCQRYLPRYGDRTVDQMVQAARSGKQNIVEGSEDGKTSTELELKLLNVARSSIDELREDYEDYLASHNLPQWGAGHPRYAHLQEYTKRHNSPEDYLTLAEQWSDEEFANTCLTLCYQVDAMLNKYLANLEKTLVTEGGIKERMHKARTGYRQNLDDHYRQLQADNASLQAENASLKAENASLKAAYDDLKARALKAYNTQQEEIASLKKQLGL